MKAGSIPIQVAPAITDECQDFLIVIEGKAL